MRKLVTTLVLAMSLLVAAAGIGVGAPAATQEKSNGVTVIGDDCLAAADTPAGAVRYAATLVDH